MAAARGAALSMNLKVGARPWARQGEVWGGDAKSTFLEVSWQGKGKERQTQVGGGGSAAKKRALAVFDWSIPCRQRGCGAAWGDTVGGGG